MSESKQQNSVFEQYAPFIVNNFPSSYLAAVAPNAQRIIHVGEIDPAIHSLSRNGIESVIAAEINPTTAAIGLWKKEAIRQQDRFDYIAMLSLLFGFPLGPSVEFALKRRKEEIGPFKHETNAQIMENLPPWARTRLDQFLERPNVGMGNGPITNLNYLDSSLYDRVRDNLGRLDIQVADIFDLLPLSEKVDLISINNIFDYVEGDLTGRFNGLAGSLNESGRLVIVSMDAAPSRIVVYSSDGKIMLPTRLNGGKILRYATTPEGNAILLSDYLSGLGLRLTNDKIVDCKVRYETFEEPVSPTITNLPPYIPRGIDSSKIETASTEKALKDAYTGLMRRYDGKKGLKGRFESLGRTLTKNNSDIEWRWEGYWKDVQKEAEVLGISPFEKSGRIFLYEFSRTPTFFIARQLPSLAVAGATVEIYKK